MRYEKINEYFEKGVDGLSELLEDTKDMRDTIEDYRSKFKGNILTTADEYDEAMIVLTGIFMYVVEIFESAQAFKEAEEDTAYLKLRNEAIEKGEKAPTDNTLKVMAHKQVAPYIKLRNTFESYMLGCEKGISTCQSKLKKFERVWGGKQTDDK
jgi:hypothetical protein